MGKYGLTHKYIRLHTTEEEFRQAIDDREYEEVGCVAITGDRETTPDTYQYSTRTTNNDDEYLAQYNAIDDVLYFNSLEIIWGYFGWQWEDIELNGQTYHGGHFYEKIITDTYPQIDDGYRLYHIDNLTSNTPNVVEVGYFDASNIVSAQNAFSSNVKKINTNNFPVLVRVTNMFNGCGRASQNYVPDNELFLPEVVDASNMFSANTCQFNQFCKFPVIHFGKVEKLANFAYMVNFKNAENSQRIEDCLLGIEKVYDYTNFIGCNKSNGAIYSPIFFTPPYTGEETMIFDRAFRTTSYVDGIDINFTKPWKITRPDYSSSQPHNIYPSYYFIYNSLSYGASIDGDVDFHNSFDYLVEADCIFKGLSFDATTYAQLSPKHDNRIVVMFFDCHFNSDISFDCLDTEHEKSFSCRYFTVDNACIDFRSCDFHNHQVTLANVDKLDALILYECTNISKLNATFRTYTEDGTNESYYWVALRQGNLTLSAINDIPSLFTRYFDINHQSQIDFTGSDFTVYLDIEHRHSDAGFDFTSCEGMLSTPILKSINGVQDEGDNVFYINTQINAPNENLQHFRAGEYNLLYYTTAEYSFIDLFSIDFDNCTELVTFDVGSNYLNWKLSYCKKLDTDIFMQSVNRQRDAYTRTPDKNQELYDGQKRKLWIHRTVYDKLSAENQALLLVKFNVVNIVEDELQTT